MEPLDVRSWIPPFGDDTVQRMLYKQTTRYESTSFFSHPGIVGFREESAAPVFSVEVQFEARFGCCYWKSGRFESLSQMEGLRCRQYRLEHCVQLHAGSGEFAIRC